MKGSKRKISKHAKIAILKLAAIIGIFGFGVAGFLEIHNQAKEYERNDGKIFKSETVNGLATNEGEIPKKVQIEADADEKTQLTTTPITGDFPTPYEKMESSTKEVEEEKDPMEWIKGRGVKYDYTPNHSISRREFMDIIYSLWGKWFSPEKASVIINSDSVNETPKDEIPLEIDAFYQLFSGITVRPLAETKIDLRASEPLLKWELGAEFYWFLQSWGYNIPYGRPEHPTAMALATAEAEKTLKEICGSKIESLIKKIDLEDAQIAHRALLVEAARDGAKLLERLEIGMDIPLDQPITAAELAKSLLKLEKMSLGAEYPTALKSYVDYYDGDL